MELNETMEETLLAQHPQVKSPDFVVRTSAAFVGNGWLKPSPYGKFVKIVLFKDVTKGTTLFLTPAK